MTRPDPKPRQALLPQNAQIWDDAKLKYVPGWRADFKRQEVVTLLDGIIFNASTTTKNGTGVEVRQFKTALILIDLAVTGAPTDIVYSIEFSVNNVDWFKYVLGSFGDLRYEDGAGAKTEALDIPVLAPFMRCKGVATGTDASKLFTTTVRAILNG